MPLSHPCTDHVIVGNSAAALSAINAIRKNGLKSSITLISAEDCWAYSPVLLTYYMAGRISRRQVFLTDAAYYERNGVRLKLGDRVTAIDCRTPRVALASGDTVSYDRLLIATGSSAKRMGVQGDQLPGVFTIKTLEDADRILSYTAGKKRIAIIGGGLVGLQAANALAESGRDISVMIGSDRPLSQNVDADCSRFITQRIEKSGMSILFNIHVEQIAPDNGRLTILMNTGKTMTVDAVIVGKGVKPNVDIAQRAGIDTNWGIVVDDRMQTSLPDVFAAGDVAEGLNQATGEAQVVATWANACVQGKTAGINMSGGDAACAGLSGNVCSILGNSIASVGVTRPETGKHQCKSYTDPGGTYYRNIIFGQNDEIAGAVMMGHVSDIGVIRSMILNRIRVPRRIKEKIVRGPISYGDVYGCCLNKIG